MLCLWNVGKNTNNNNNINTLFIFHKPINNIISSFVLLFYCVNARTIWIVKLILIKLKVFLWSAKCAIKWKSSREQTNKYLIYIDSFLLLLLCIFDFNWFKCYLYLRYIFLIYISRIFVCFVNSQQLSMHFVNT